MKFSRSLHGLVLLASVWSFASAAPLLAQSSVLDLSRKLASKGPPASPPGAQKQRRSARDATATIAFGANESVTAYCHRGRFDRVGLRRDQMVDVAVQYSTPKAGQAIAVESLDGGQVIAPAKNQIVGADGMIHFKFRAGHQPGVYQIALHNGGQELGLQFWVVDEEHPRNNPPVVNSGN